MLFVILTFTEMLIPTVVLQNICYYLLSYTITDGANKNASSY